MKKIISVAVTVVLLLSLCGCDAIDEMRQKQAIYVDGTDHRQIEYADKLFVKFDVDLDKYDSMVGCYDEVYVTESDVPLLLSSYYGDYFWTNDEKTVIEGNGFYYVCEDVYESAKAEVVNGIKFTDYCFERIDDETGEWYTYYLSTYEKQILEDIISRSSCLTFTEYPYELCAESIALSSISDSGLFGESRYEISRTDGKYYVIETVDEYAYRAFPVSTNAVDILEEFLDSYY